MSVRFSICVGLVAVVLAGCAPTPLTPAPTSIQAEPQSLIVMTHDSYAISETALAQFEASHHARVQFLKAGDTGAALNKAILAKGNPLADVFYGVDNTFLSRALNEDIFEPYASPALSNVPQAFQLDARQRVTPVDYGDVCPNYDIAYFESHNLAPPQNLEDLLKPEYKSLLVVENPATSSPGLAFLLATLGHFGEAGYLDYWRGLVANEVLVVNDWETAYYTEFSLHGGPRPIVISYGSSPPAEVLFAESPLDEAPSAVVTGGGSCFRQIEFAGVLKGARNRSLAESWLDFMLSPAFQEDVPLQMFVFPVATNARLPEAFSKYYAIPEETSQVSPELISANREAWIQAWTEAVLR